MGLLNESKKHTTTFGIFIKIEAMGKTMVMLLQEQVGQNKHSNLNITLLRQMPI